MNIVILWEMVDDSELPERTVGIRERALVIMDRIAYKDPNTQKQFHDVLAQTSVEELINLFEELHIMEVADNGVDDYDSSNAYQTLMEINRSVGLHRQVLDIPSTLKRRLI